MKRALPSPALIYRPTFDKIFCLIYQNLGGYENPIKGVYIVLLQNIIVGFAPVISIVLTSPGLTM